MRSLVLWEKRFNEKLDSIDTDQRDAAGVLLKAIPSRSDWESFLTDLRAIWESSANPLSGYRACTIMLYGGIAFFEYEDNRFWPKVARVLGVSPIPGNKQSQINEWYSRSAERFDLPISERSGATQYVGSSIRHIGIPISIWEGFLEICEWAIDHRGWENLSDEDWRASMSRRVGSRTRLKNFLLENRETSSQMIKEMLDARDILARNADWTVGDLKQASLLRPEYFDEVAETADFLRPENPDSLLKDSPRLFLDIAKGTITLHVPGIEVGKLPATWRVGQVKRDASSAPQRIAIDGEAFKERLEIISESGGHSENAILRGIEPFGLADLNNNGLFVNPKREKLPVRSYVLISKTPLGSLARHGFHEEDCPLNEPYELTDGTILYNTRLDPSARIAHVSFISGEESYKIAFRSRDKVESLLFVGEGIFSAAFSRSQDRFKVEHLPAIAVSIPKDYYRDDLSVLNREYCVTIDGGSQCRTFGRWVDRFSDDDRRVYVWEWSGKAVGQQREEVVLSSLQELGKLKASFEPVDLSGKRLIGVKAERFGHSFQYEAEIRDEMPPIQQAWHALPGKYLLWFLLCQNTDGMAWEDLMLAKQVIAPEAPYISGAHLRSYAKHGFFVQRGRRYSIAESRAQWSETGKTQWTLKYCGDPSILWCCYRYLSNKPGFSAGLPVVEVIACRGALPHLSFSVDGKEQRDWIEKYFSDKHHAVRFVKDLWEG